MAKKPKLIENNITNTYPKVYTKGEIGWGSRLIKELICLGGMVDKNNMVYGNNPYYLYYIGKDGVIRYIDIDSPESYFLLDSSDWKELTFKKTE